MPALPNCIVIGAMKAGTTSLHNYLDVHPEVFASKVKEINFFIEEKNFNKGLDWYKNQFDPTIQIRVESSQNYTKRHVFKNVPGKIKSILGEEVKLIYIVREPIQRMKSHYLERLTAGHVENNMNFNDALYKHMEKLPLEENHTVQTSMYAYQLEPYLKLFKKENIHILKSEDLYKDTLKEMNNVFSFLGLKQLNDPELFQSQFNRSSDKYFDPVWLKNIYFKLRDVPGGHFLINKIKTSTVFRKKITDQSSLDQELTDKLRNIFSKEANVLEELKYY